MLQDLWLPCLWLAGFWLESHLGANTKGFMDPFKSAPLKLVRSVLVKMKGFGVACLEADIFQVL